jgi:hypothetical protein
MSHLKRLNWNQMSELGLIAKINNEILHPLGLAMSRNPDTGHSESVLVSDDGVFEYAPDMDIKKLSDDEIRDQIMRMEEI